MCLRVHFECVSVALRRLTTLSEQELDPVHGIGETGFTDHNLKKIIPWAA